MKVAFDENMPAAMVRVFQLFHNERSLKHIVAGVVLESAKDYTPRRSDPDYKPKDDVPWVKRFSASGGKVIISGDVRMASVPHERLALVQEGMVVVFFAPKWGQWPFCRKAALLLHWWPAILRQVKRAKPGFFVVPCAWPEDRKSKLRRISTDDAKMVKIQRQIAETAPKRQARKARRQSESQGRLMLEGGKP